MHPHPVCSSRCWAPQSRSSPSAPPSWRRRRPHSEPPASITRSPRPTRGCCGDFATASDHYAKALEETADHVPSIRGARRVLTQLGRFLEALPLFEAELRVTPDSTARALLQHQKGRFLQEFLGETRGARNATCGRAGARSHQPHHPESRGARRGGGARLALPGRDLRRAADAVKAGPPPPGGADLRRAQLLENELADTRRQPSFTRGARLDPEARGVRSRRWRASVGGGGTSANWPGARPVGGAKPGPAERALALYRLGRVHADRLGNRQQALSPRWARPWPRAHRAAGPGRSGAALRRGRRP